MKFPQNFPWKTTGETLGRGGQGQVHLVTRSESGDGAQYALKVLHNPGSEQALQRFRREIEVVQKIDHHSVIKIEEYADTNDTFQYFVMEYHDGARPLSKIISSPHKNPFHGNILQSLSLFERIITAISVCEKSIPPIVHRDIKPQNILVLRDDNICLIDFGICQIDQGKLITFSDENVGSRYYMAPECGAGNENEIGVHSDIYSAAKVLWSTITSKQIFDREKPVFGSLSMKELFPTRPETWHLSHIFKNTIRELPENRVPGTKETIELIRDIRYVAQRGFPPLEEMKARCPSCGLKELGEFPKARNAFGDYNLREAAAFQCYSCGFVFLRDARVLKEELERISNLS